MARVEPKQIVNPNDTSKYLRGDGTWATVSASASPIGNYATGTIAVLTGQYCQLARRIILTGSQNITIQGTGCLRIN